MKRLQKRLAQLEAKLRYGATKFSKSQLFGIIQNILVVEAAIATSRAANQIAANQIKAISPITWTIEAKTRRQEGKFWVARLVGKDDKYTFQRQFLKSDDLTWGKYGMQKAVFEIDSCGYYQDSDREYFKVFTNEKGEFDAVTVSFMEVKEFFYHELIAA